ncbi:geranylgeranylglycerol-phosphate geranylgeranyltransferase [Lacihabitans sp. LS3-19]|uniref:geranylgeranylglycerol-phosphate geranylgeranyltransferase n=1 Tax=Lacihabitans sp. LS3-19 TaxID=2487335 RepID=UPI0020CFBA1A|nr:geranylgeranylglycerol-phosphate geranylgeranyltransferase [Lacihabitans sp. LS3-19]
MIAFTQYLVAYFLIKLPDFQIFENWRFAILVLSTVFIAAGGYVINDYFDVKIDQINKPDEVFVGRIIKRRFALLIHQIFSGIGVVLSVFLGWKILIINVLSVSILWFYASVFKKKPLVGNFIVASLTALSVSEIAIYLAPDQVIVHVYALFAFFINLMREIIKDIEDIKGDQMHGAKTLPIVLGIRKTKNVIYSLAALFICTVLILLFRIDNRNLWFCFSVLFLFLVFLVYRLILADRKKHFSDLSMLCKVILLLGVLSVVFI